MIELFYVSGRGGSLDKGLAPALSKLADSFDGIAVDVPFLKKPPITQVGQIQSKITENPDRIVVANSYGAYLTLQALVALKVTPKKVLLLSPVLGIAQAKDRMYMSRPPLTGRLKEAFDSRLLAKPETFKVLMGNQDELYNQEQIALFDDYFGSGSALILDDETHMLSHEAVKAFVEEYVLSDP